MQQTPILSIDIGFLVAYGLDCASLIACTRRAQELGVSAMEVLIFDGYMEETAYYRALAHKVGVPFFDADRLSTPHTLGRLTPYNEPQRLAKAPVLSFMQPQGRFYLTAPRGAGVIAFMEHVRASTPPHNTSLALTSPRLLQDVCVRLYGADILAQALQDLPLDESARRLPSLLWLIAAGCCVLLLAFIMLPTLMKTLALISITLIFLIGVALRVNALEHAFSAPTLPDTTSPPTANGALPRYSILVPLYKEAHMVPQLLAALYALNYPKSLLEIFILVESDDTPTVQAVLSQALEPHITMLSVPKGQPKTKPRALQYGLGTSINFRYCVL